METLLKRFTERGDAPLNVNPTERWLSVILGGMAVLAMASRPSLRTGALAAAGTILIRRGVTGHCPGLGALGVDTLVDAPEDRLHGASPEHEGHDMVDEAGEESFPASDAPAWSGSVPQPKPPQGP